MGHSDLLLIGFMRKIKIVIADCKYFVHLFLRYASANLKSYHEKSRNFKSSNTY
jgi:hypothetical protein